MERASCVAILDPEVPDRDLADVLTAAGEHLPGARVTRGDGWAAVPVGDGARAVDWSPFERSASVRRLVEIAAPYRLASRELFGKDVGIDVPIRQPDPAAASGVTIGGRAPLALIVGSRWASTNESRFRLLAPLLQEAGCRIYHAGQLVQDAGGDAGAGLTLDALRRLRAVADEHGLGLSVEVWDAHQIPEVAEVADVLQVGSRNMQDFSLLREMGRTSRPVLLRRGAGATVEEFLLAAEYVLLHGNGKVILCESGIRTFDALSKPRFEINAIPLIKQLSHLPLLADPSLTAPQASAVPAMSRAAVAAGADGLFLDVATESVHDPEGIAIDIEAMQRLVSGLRPVARAVGRTVGTHESELRTQPADADAVLGMTDRTLAQTIESITAQPPHLDVVSQWRLDPPVPWLSPPLSVEGEILARCTGYRMGSLRLSLNLSYVDLGRIDHTLGALLEAKQLNLGQLFVDPRIEKRSFEFGTSDDAGEMDDVFRRWFPDELDEVYPYVWRRYHAAIGGVVTFVVIEALPVSVWGRLLAVGGNTFDEDPDAA